MAWSPDSWRAKEARHLPAYPDAAAAARVARGLRAKPVLVDFAAIQALKNALGGVATGRGFLLQGGDCAESFHASESDVLATVRLLRTMAGEIGKAGAGRVVRVGRLAGQFAKPRTSPVERRGQTELPSYRGDIVNGIGFFTEERTPDPSRMIEGYQRAKATLSLIEGEGLYTSHEALLLPFEEALVRIDGESGKPCAASAHMLWLGYRTGDLGGAHAEFLRGIANPLGIKIGPETGIERVLRLLDLLNPENQAGRITLVCRFGRKEVAEKLPPLVRAVEGRGAKVVWSCDPMHANTVRTGEGLKTRRFGDIRAEALAFFEILAAEGAHPGGIHLELTGADVTECTGGAESVAEEMLASRYHTHCDPRLNAAQSLELARLVGRAIARGRAPGRHPARRGELRPGL